MLSQVASTDLIGHGRIMWNLRTMMAGLLLSLGAAANGNAAAEPQEWTAAWMSGAVAPIPDSYPADIRRYDNVTVRQSMRIGTRSTRLRVVLSNQMGDLPVHVRAIHIVLADASGRPVTGTDRPITFGGRSDVILAPGAPLYSDPVDFPAPAMSEVIVSVFYPGPAQPAGHLESVTVSGPGDLTMQAQDWTTPTTRGPAIVSRIDVAGSATGVVVAVGDSITEGPAFWPGHHPSWPEQLAALLATADGGSELSVLNAGIGGNRLLHSGSGEGPAALARFDRDVLDVPGVRDVVLLEGINDIGFGVTSPDEKVDAADIVSAYRQLILRAHARHVRIFAGTLTPYEGSAYFTADGERIRQAVNAFIRSGSFDGVIDFDNALRDPTHPQRLLPAYARPDKLHPSDAGFAAMAHVAYTLPIFTANRSQRGGTN